MPEIARNCQIVNRLSVPEYSAYFNRKTVKVNTFKSLSMYVTVLPAIVHV